MGMEIKPPISQGPIAGPEDQTGIDAAHETVSTENPAPVANPGVSPNTVLAMKQVGTQMKGFMNTTEGFLRQRLAGELEGAGAHDESSAALMDFPMTEAAGQGTPALFGSQVTSAQTQGAAATTQSSSLDAAKKEAQALMDKGNKLLQEHRYNEALEAFQEGYRTYPSNAFVLNEASALLDAGRFSEAVQAYERYLSDPAAPRADEARAAMERAKSFMGGREATATGVVESRKEFDKASEAFQAGRYQEALEGFEKAYELNPLADFKFNQAACLEKLGRPYAAADALQAYVNAKPDRVSVPLCLIPTNPL